MNWPHTLVITRTPPAAGAQSADTGAWTPDAEVPPTTLYNDEGFLWHQSRSQSRRADGDPAPRSDGTVYIKNRALSYMIKSGDIVVARDKKTGVETTSRVVDVDALVGRLFVETVVARAGTYEPT